MAEREAPPAIIAGATVQAKTMADDTLRLTIDIEPRHAQAAFAAFGSRGTPIAIARLTKEAAVAETRREQAQAAPPVDYGKHYELLYKRGWWHNPEVMKVFGVTVNQPPEDRIEAIKKQIYDFAGVTSLTQISPRQFMDICDAHHVRDTLPRYFGEGA